MMSWTDSVLQTDGHRRAFNRDRLKEEAAIGIDVLMREQGVHRAELASRAGLCRSYITRIMSGDMNMTLDTLADLYFALGVQVHFTYTDITSQLQPPTRLEPADAE